MASIELRNVRKSFGLVDVIKGVDLEVRKGEFMVFVGPSGCGKSTLLRLISGLEDITSGTLQIDGKVVNQLAPSKRGSSNDRLNAARVPLVCRRASAAVADESRPPER